MSNRGFILIAMLGCQVAWPALSAADALPNSGEPGFFGIGSGDESLADHARLFPLLRDAGASSVRSFPGWASIQPRKGTWDWSQADALIESARKNNVQIAGVLCYLAPWASSAAPGETDQANRTRTFPIKDIQDWRNYVRAVLTRYHKDVRYWEIYNEFNAAAFTRKAVLKDYVEMVRSAFEVAQEVDPNCKIGIGCAEVDLGFLEQVISLGASDHFDFVNVHPYALLGAAMEGREPVFLGMSANLRKMLAQTGQRRDIALWISEIGYTSTDLPVAEDKQAQALAKGLVLSLVQGFERVFWFEGRGPSYGPSGDFGLLRKDWTPRPSYLAHQTLTSLLGPHPEYLGWLNSPSRSYAFLFRGSAGLVLVTWSAGSEADYLRFPAAVRVTELAGESRPLKAGEQLARGAAPVCVTELPAKFEADARANRSRRGPWFKDFSQLASISCRLGADRESGLTLLDRENGKTVAGLVDGVRARRTDAGSDLHYMHFDVDDSFASVGDRELEITLVAKRVDPAQEAGCGIFCETSRGYRQTEKWWAVPAGPGWHSFTFRIDDANFANCWGWNFRIQTKGAPGDLWVKEVIVNRIRSKK